ncbi:MAG: glycine-rich protein, partial [Candidatus Cybelea sp.]
MLYLRKLTTIWLSIAVLAACASNNVLLPSTARGAHGSQAFPFIGTIGQTFTVPAGVNRVTITAYGARGAGEAPPSGRRGGLGAAIKATVPVQPGQTLLVTVGSQGNGARGGFNGGGNAGGFAFGGGGSSDIRTGNGTKTDRIFVAGGGGGAGQLGAGPGGSTCPGGAGGKGGGIIGERGGRGRDCGAPAGGGAG